MDRFNHAEYSQFLQLPLEELNCLKYSVYVIDFNWNYLFVNDFVKQNLGPKGENLIGKNMWDEFRELTSDPTFILMRKNTERGLATNIITTSPVTGQKLNIIGYPLKDCYLFTSSILPKKEDLLDELRNALKNSSSA